MNMAQCRISDAKAAEIELEISYHYDLLQLEYLWIFPFKIKIVKFEANNKNTRNDNIQN